MTRQYYSDVAEHQADPGMDPAQFFYLIVAVNEMTGRNVYDETEVLVRRLAPGEMPKHNKIVVVRIGTEYTLEVLDLEDDYPRLMDAEGTLVASIHNDSDVELMGVVTRISYTP